MEFGVCCGPKIAPAAKAAGYDFGETAVGGLLKPLKPQEEFEAGLANWRASGLPYVALNVFVPGDIKIVGPEANSFQLEDYVKMTCARAEQAGVEVIVLGSGKARRIPEGFDAAAAHDQMLWFANMSAPIAESHGVTLVVEPLNVQECNTLNTVAECAALVREVAHPAFRLLVDAYHMMLDNDPWDDIVANADLLAHVHLATVPNRMAPSGEPCDFAPFFEALAKGGYDGRVSIEANSAGLEPCLDGALSLMKSLAEKARGAASE